MPRDLRTKAIVLRRTNFGESDRILNLLTPEGKINLIARGVRKEKSRLAGGIELFSVADVVIHQGRAELGILTGARMLHFYGRILTDLPRLEFASLCLKQFSRAADQVDNPEHFSLLQQILTGLDAGLPLALVETWFWFNLARVSGEEVNLSYDINNQKLSPEKRYYWEESAGSLKLNPSGDIKDREIKLARLMLGQSLAWVAKVENTADSLPPLLKIAKSLN